MFVLLLALQYALIADSMLQASTGFDNSRDFSKDLFCMSIAHLMDQRNIPIAIVPDNSLGRLIRKVTYECSIDIWLLKERRFDTLQGHVWIQNLESSLSNASFSDGIFSIETVISTLIRRECTQFPSSSSHSTSKSARERIMVLTHPLGLGEQMKVLLNGSTVPIAEIDEYTNSYAPMVLNIMTQKELFKCDFEVTVKSPHSYDLTVHGSGLGLHHGVPFCASKFGLSCDRSGVMIRLSCDRVPRSSTVLTSNDHDLEFIFNEVVSITTVTQI